MTAICSRLKEIKNTSLTKDLPIGLRLPPDSFLETIESQDLQLAQQQCSYTLSFVSQALQHASGLLTIMSLPFTRQIPGMAIVSSFQDYLPSLLDSFLTLHDVQQRWHAAFSGSLPKLLQNNLSLIESFDTNTNRGPEHLVREKAFIVLTILCTEVSDQPGLNVSQQDPNPDVKLLCTGLVTVAGACLSHKPVSRLARSQLLPVLEKQLISDINDDNDSAGRTEFWVSAMGHVLSNITDGHVEVRGAFEEGNSRSRTTFHRSIASIRAFYHR